MRWPFSDAGRKLLPQVDGGAVMAPEPTADAAAGALPVAAPWPFFIWQSIAGFREWLTQYRVAVCLCSIVALAFTVRTIGITHNPPGFYADEAAYGINAYDVLHHGRDEYGVFLPALF